MNFRLPEQVEKIRKALSEKGYESYIVGGCVRDILMGKIPDDYDITTSAEPHETAECFAGYKIIEIGIKHGTVAVIIDHNPYEITTFRTDGVYKDNRHPESVSFTKSLEEDLSRRDFTVNAIAYNPQTGITDPFNGKSDIERKFIRCVGDPLKRFEEDSLRILRGIRFSSVLGFEIHPETASAMHIRKNLISNISRERIHTEFMKMLMGNPDALLKEFADVFEVILPPFKSATLDNTPKNKYIRLALLLDESYSEASLKELKSDSKTITAVKELQQFLKSFKRRELLLLAGELKAASAEELVLFLIHSGKTEAAAILKDALNKKLCLSAKDLEISGKDLEDCGIPKGKMMGEILNELLTGVIDGKFPNEKSALISRAKEFLKKQ